HGGGHVVVVRLLGAPNRRAQRARRARGGRVDRLALSPRGVAKFRYIVAEGSFVKSPNWFPSVSSHVAKYPIDGMGVLPIFTLPPSASTFFKASSIESTLIVMLTTLLSGL